MKLHLFSAKVIHLSEHHSAVALHTILYHILGGAERAGVPRPLELSKAEMSQRSRWTVAHSERLSQHLVNRDEFKSGNDLCNR